MKRYVPIIVSFFLFLLFTPSLGDGYLLSPAYVLQRMVLNYRSLKLVKAVQRVEAYGEDIAYPFASVDERVEWHSFVPIKIWVGEKEVGPTLSDTPELNANHFLFMAQWRYGFYKDVFMNHEVNLINSLLGKLGIVPAMDRLRLLFPRIAYQIGDGLTHESLKGLWVDKDRFIPLRLVGVLKKEVNGVQTHEVVDIRYEDYRFLEDKIWYPFDIKFFIDHRLSIRIKTLSASLITE